MDWMLDRLMPEWDFRTRYTRRIAAPPDAVWAAMLAVTADELPLTRLLMGVRSAGTVRLTGALLDVLPGRELGRADGRELVKGLVARFWQARPARGPEETRSPAGFAAFTGPGWVKAALGIGLSPLPGEAGTLVAVETRTLATDAASLRRFRRYWFLIRLGGAGLIRIEMLRALARRAERGG